MARYIIYFAYNFSDKEVRNNHFQHFAVFLANERVANTFKDCNLIGLNSKGITDICEAYIIDNKLDERQRIKINGYNFVDDFLQIYGI